MRSLHFPLPALLVVVLLGWCRQPALATIIHAEGVTYDSTPQNGAPNGTLIVDDPTLPGAIIKFPAPATPSPITRIRFGNSMYFGPIVAYVYGHGNINGVQVPSTGLSPSVKKAAVARPQTSPPSTFSVSVSNDADTFDLTSDLRYAVVVGFPANQSPVSLVDSVAGREIQTLDYPNQTSAAAAIGDDGQTVLVVTGPIGVSSIQTTIRRLQLSNGTLADSGQTLVLGPNTAVSKICIAPGSKTGVALVITSNVGTSSQLIAFTLPGLVPTGTVNLSKQTGNGLVINPSGNRVFARSGDRATHPDVVEGFGYNATTGSFTSSTATLTISPLSGYTGSLLQNPLGISPDGTLLFLLEQNADNILSGPRVGWWDASTGTLVTADTSVGSPDTLATGSLTISTTVTSAKVSLSNLAQIYTGSPLPVTVTTTPAGLSNSVTYSSATYPASTTPPTNAGSYTATATITDPSYTGSAKGTLVISKAAAGVTLGNLNLTYNGTPQSATATTTPSGLNVTLTYNGKASAPTNVGSYKVVATVTDPNHAGTGTGTLVIAKAAATVTVGSQTLTYTGKALAATATITPSGLPATYTYTLNGKKASPVNAGTYDVTATVNNANGSGSGTGTLTIDPEPVALTFGNLSVPFTGKPIAATGTTSPVKVPLTFTYSGTASASTPPIVVGSYPVTASPTSANFIISNTATATLDVVPPVTFAPLPATPLLSASGVQVGRGINPGGIATTAYFEYSTDSNFGTFNVTPTVKLGAGKAQILLSAFLGELTPGVTYYYKVVTVSAAGTFTSDVQQFTTLGFDVSEVASTGTVAPGTALNWATLGSGAINMADGAAFKATLAGVAAAANTGLWANLANSGTLSLVAQTGSAAPDAGGSPLGTTFTALTDPVLNDAGDVAFGGTLKAATGIATAATANGVWASHNGTLALVAREGSAAPGADGANFATFTASALSGQGAIVAGTLAASPALHVTAANNTGVWEGTTSNSLTLWLRNSEVTDAARTIATFKFLPAETYVSGQTRGFGPATGHLAATATYTDKTSGLIKVTSAGSPRAVATVGDAAAGTAGAVFATFGAPAINDSDHVAFAATLKAGTGDAVKANAGGIWADDSGGVRQLRARLGQIAPGTGTSATFTAFNDPVYNANDAVAFRATLSTGAGAATAASNLGLWCDSTGTLALVARTGDAAPGCPAGVKYAAFPQLALDDNQGATQQGGAVYLATLAGTGVTAANNAAIFAVDSAGHNQLIVRTGDVLGGKTITALVFLPVETATGNAPVAGQGRSLAPATGDLLYNATFSDKSQAIFNVVFP